eukprot:CAMPEP_0198734814 /NCGR_PEP_ID=MMETSP1475-20131203/55331_1 /TAXON_ID= ORGANISM="Unidentified sp., Strain CCMP1999" /NCGR_SAMPLE_ID=MMETSP1475 /ASSEMBLY_ACC=CAM_ASM_001111 /LENGTH=136 /DNA_ID=CAMNT_0044498361 /DNA_START=367 /DNA_END=777 /DNA_ORIENTATION=+
MTELCFVQCVPGAARVLRRQTVVAAKSKRKQNKTGRGKKKYQQNLPSLDNYVDAPPADDDLTAGLVQNEPMKSKLSPISGGKDDLRRKKKKKGAEEPPAITYVKRATWGGIALLVCVELYVHLIAVGDWIPKGNAS